MRRSHGLSAPVPIHFAQAIPIACLGLAVNMASAWLLSRGHIITIRARHHHMVTHMATIMAGI